MDVTSLHPLVHGLAVRLVLGAAPNFNPSLVEVAVGILFLMHVDQAAVQVGNRTGNPRLVAPAAVGEEGVLIGMEFLPLGQVRLEVFRGLDGGGIHADFFSAIHVVDPAHGNAEFLVGGNSVVHAFKLSTGDERGVDGIENALAVFLQQVAMLSVIVVQGSEQLLSDGTDVGLPVCGEEDVDLFAGLQGGQRLVVPVAPADDLELNIRVDQGLHISIDGVLNSFTGVDVVVADFVILQRHDFTGGLFRGLSGFFGSLGLLSRLRRLGVLGGRSLGLCTGGHREHKDQRHEQSYDLLEHIVSLLAIFRRRHVQRSCFPAAFCASIISHSFNIFNTFVK